MDTSNPVVPQDRRTIEEIRASQMKRRRQDLEYLGSVARTAERVQLPVLMERLSVQEVKDITDEYKKRIPRVSPNKDEALPEVFVKEFDSVPVCGVLDETMIPLHPPGKNQVGGSVTVTRTMGGVPPPPLGLQSVIEVVGDRVLECGHVYTSGTWKGFVKRLRDQCGRDTVSLLTSYRRALGNKKLQPAYLIKRLDALFPRDPAEGWPDWSEDLSAHLEKIKVTANSSAGAPYWRNKADCMEEILTGGLPVVVKAIKEGKLDRLWKEQPEMFVVEVKNKTDRYEIEKLEEKTRPYGAIPAHWAFLFSVLCQRFQEGLHTFDKNDSSCNAYGFSAVRGGLTRMHQWMLRATKRGRFIVYGDDSCLVFKRPDGVYRVDPDFKQMDGSLDGDDMKLVVEWVLASLAREAGGELPHFWKVVGGAWVKMASDPYMLIDGPTVYRKRKPNGLLSGVPGTTLFDTVKSALAWDLYLDQCEVRGWDPMDEARATSFMLEKCGLVIKPGTWKPAKLPDLKPGVLVTDHKFLGVQMLPVHWEGVSGVRTIIVPHIPEEEAIEMMCVQKDDPHVRERSKLTAARRLYDRMRGLMITCGFNHDLVIDAIHNVVNQLDPTAILLCTNLGTGERPDHILLEDWAYPDSSGFPTKEFCYSLYGDEEEMDEELKRFHWRSLFPSLEPLLVKLRAERREIRPAAEKATPPVAEVCGKETDQFRVMMVETATQTDFDHPEFAVLATLPRAETAPPLQMAEKPNPRSHIQKVTKEVTRKTLPNLGESVMLFLEEQGGVAKVGEVRDRFMIGYHAMKKVAYDYALYVTGWTRDDVVALFPVETPAETVQSEVAAVAAARADVVSAGVERRVEAAAVLKDDSRFLATHPLVTCPPVVWWDEQFLKDAGPPPQYSSVDEARALFTSWIGRIANVYRARWRTANVYLTTEGRPEPNPVGVALEIQLVDSGQASEGGEEPWYRVAYCRSLNKKMAQGVICASYCRRHDRPLPGDVFTAGVELKPLSETEAANWATQDERFRREDVMAPPTVVATQLNTTSSSEEGYGSDGSVSDELKPLYEQYLHSRYSPEQAREMALKYGPGWLARQEPGPVSKRSKLRPEQRTKLNRKRNERKKRRYNELREEAASKAPRISPPHRRQ